MSTVGSISKLVAIILLTCLGFCGFAQEGNVGIGTRAPHPSAALDISNNMRGILIPRMNTANKQAIPEPAKGLLVFDISINRFSYFNGKAWVNIDPGTHTWDKNLNDICYSTGNVGIGTCQPKDLLHLHSDTSDVRQRFSVPGADYIVGIDETEGSFYIGRDSLGLLDKLLVLKGQSAGIGTDQPKNLLHLNSGTIPTAIRMSHDSLDKQYIVGIDETEGSFFVQSDSLGTLDKLFVLKDNRAGIGVDQPKSTLHLKSDNEPTHLRFSHDNTSPDYIVGIDETEGAIVVGRDSAGILLTNFIIDSTGRAGVGRIDTAARFFVDGKMKASDLIIDDGVNDVYSLSSTNGNFPWKNQSISLYKINSFSYNGTSSYMIWDKEHITTHGTAYNYATGSAYIEVLETGVYQVYYAVGGTATLNATTTVELTKVVGAVHSTVPGSKSIGSHLIGLGTQAAVSRLITLELNAGDKLAVKVTGSGSTTGIIDACAFSIVKLY